ncbi:basigin-like [Oppia nitens]|uniref:basigin-like n=1 Tax=Oppia nitens TaxID=1686743 RepID=UPI0023DB019E|nr:basigin-like [Oppia nitens]
MKFYLLLLKMFYSFLFFLNFITIYLSDNVLTQEWMKSNDVVYYGPKYVTEGQTFEIMCQMSKFKAPRWTKNELPTGESKRFSYTNKIGIEMTRIEVINVSNASAQDSGYYRCNSFSRSYHQISVITSEPIPNTEETSTTADILFNEIKEDYTTITLKCPLLYDTTQDTEFFWYKNNINIVNDERRTVEKTQLIIRNATSAVDAGDYMCRAETISQLGGSQFGQIIQLRAPIRIKPFTRSQNVMLGRPFTLQCNYTGYPVGKIHWLIGNEKISSIKLSELGIEIKPNTDSHPDAVLVVRNATQLHTNSYTCVVNNRFSEDERSVIITVRDRPVNGQSPLILAENRELILGCNYTDSEGRPVIISWKWSKDGINYEDFDEEDKKRMKIDERDHSLIISKGNKVDIGNWRCTNPSDEQQFLIIIVRAKPYLYPFEEFQKTNYKSANIIEGQKFELKCEIISDYNRDAGVMWYKYNENEHDHLNKEMQSIGKSERIQIKEFNVTSSLLTISKVIPSDRFYYVCIADNGVTTFNNTILLRVKDKLGALWPFLGIVAEVVILCTIIFIYEKRRIKPDFDDSDDNTEPKATQDRTSSKSQDVRQRK